MKNHLKRSLSAAIALCLVLAFSAPVFAEVTYMPDVTPAMSNADFWASLCDDADEVLMTYDEIAAQNADTAAITGTCVRDLKSIPETFDGVKFREILMETARTDADYYYGWTYSPDGKLATWEYFEKLMANFYDARLSVNQKVRYAVAAVRTNMNVFPSENPIWDDPNDKDFSYHSISSVRVNEPMVIYATSADGKYYYAYTSSYNGWVKVEDVAICKDRDEWLSAWDFPMEETLVVYGSKVYTAASNTHPETEKRMLTIGTRLHSVDPETVEGLVNNRSAYHNYIVELPVRTSTGAYEKALALIPETAEVSEGYMPLTKRNVAKVALANLGDTYGWGGMLDVEDCSGLVQHIYECFGLNVPRNGNFQYYMNMAKINMANMSFEEKCLVLDKLPLGAALCFNGHEMMYLGKYDGKYYVYSTVSSMMDPLDSSKRLRVRDVTINTLDVRRANGKTWLQELTTAFMIGYGTACGQKWDFPGYQWYHDGVEYCLKNKLLSLRDDGSLGVSETVTRGETALALWRMAGSPVVNYFMRFEDVSEEQAYAEAVRWAASTKIMEGYSDTQFGAEDPVTREQLSTVLMRFAEQQGLDTSLSADTSSFRDGRNISKYAVSAMKWAVGAKLISGTDKGRLEPRGGCQRAQLAVILLRYSSLPKAPAQTAE